MPVALKEWAVTVRALAEGEQLLTLRKGGIREEGKHFEIEHDQFFLYPTFDHQRNNLVRDSHLPELGQVRVAHEVVALMIEGGVEEELIVLDLEVLALLTDPALAQREQLLTLR